MSALPRLAGLLVLPLVLPLALPLDGAPRPMTIPPALPRVTTNPEPSGLVWVPALDRYLVISDDTGLRARGTWHAPLLLAMDRAALDAEPVPIRGLPQLGDPESICAGPEGSFFVVGSQSPSHKGQVKGSRGQILHLGLVPGERALQLRGALDLRSAAPVLLLAAGADPAGRLDVEACALRHGALLLGLKAPLTVEGQAVILRIDEPVEALRTGHLGEGSVRRFRRLTLEVPVLGPGGAPAGGKVRQGISDLGLLPDGSLLVLANAPKGMPGDGGGAAYWLRAPEDPKSTPLLVGRYPGLKPEGVSLSPSGKELVLVFDHDQEPPLWLPVPLPR